MRKFLCFVALLLLLQDVSAQSNRRLLPITTGWNYPNGLSSLSSSAKDTVTNTADTLWIGIRGIGGLAPEAVTITVTTTDADVSATPDSIQIAWAAGIGNFYTTVGVLDTIGITTHVRTFVFNTTGAATANNTQASVWPYCDAIRIRILDASVVTNDSVAYVIKAMGVYNDGRIMEYLPIRYPNLGFSADTVLGTTLDTVIVRSRSKGGLAPVGIGLAFKATDVDVSNNADSLLVLYGAGVLGKYANIFNANYRMAAAPLANGSNITGIRSFIFNTTGAATAHNTQSTVSPHFDALFMQLKADDSGDSTKYEIKALGIYQKQ